MKWRYIVYIILLLVISFYCAVAVKQKKIPRSIRRIKPIYITGKDIEQEYGVIVKRYSEEYNVPEKTAILEMQVPNYISKDMARLIIVDTVHELMIKINTRPELANFFSVFPIKPENISIKVESVFGSNGEGISIAELFNGKITYTEHLSSNAMQTVAEDFRDALHYVLETDHEFIWDQDNIYSIIK